MEASKPNCLIVLIHGTYAADAKWPHADSNFCKWLAASLKQNIVGDVVFAQSPWSGGNSDLDRLQASVDLRTRLAAFRQSHPDHATFLVGHSHGGNVALHLGLVRDDLSIFHRRCIPHLRRDVRQHLSGRHDCRDLVRRSR